MGSLGSGKKGGQQLLIGYSATTLLGFREALSKAAYWLLERLANGSRPVMDRSSRRPRHVR